MVTLHLGRACDARGCAGAKGVAMGFRCRGGGVNVRCGCG